MFERNARVRATSVSVNVGIALTVGVAAMMSGCNMVRPSEAPDPDTITASADSGEVFTISSIDTSNLDVVFEEGTYYFTGVIDGFINYVAHGAGGCPPIIEAVEYTQDSITLVGKDWGDGPCQESYVLIHQRISRADGQPIPEDQVVEVRNPSNYYK